MASGFYGGSNVGPGVAAPGTNTSKVNTTNPLAPSGGAFTQQNDAFNAAQQALLGQYGPQLNAIRQQQGYAYGNGALQQELYGNNQQGMQLSYADNLGDLYTNIDTKALQQQRSAADAAAYGRMMGYNTDVFNAQGENLGNAAAKQLADINSSATAAGAFTASGTNANRRFNAVDFMTNYRALQGNYNQQQESLDMRKGGAETQTAILAREAANLGTKPALLSAQLSNGLNKLGLQNAISVNDLLQGIANGNQQAAAIYLQILQQSNVYAGAASGRG